MADLTITAAQVKLISGPKSVLTAGEAITAGQTLYQKAADSEAYKAISSAEASTAAIGIALCDCADEQQVVFAQDGAIVELGAGAAPAVGEIYSVSGTAGGLQPDADIGATEWITDLGRAIAGNRIQLKFNRTGTQHA